MTAAVQVTPIPFQNVDPPKTLIKVVHAYWPRCALTEDRATAILQGLHDFDPVVVNKAVQQYASEDLNARGPNWERVRAICREIAARSTSKRRKRDEWTFARDWCAWWMRDSKKYPENASLSWCAGWAGELLAADESGDMTGADWRAWSDVWCEWFVWMRYGRQHDPQAVRNSHELTRIVTAELERIHTQTSNLRTFGPFTTSARNTMCGRFETYASACGLRLVVREWTDGGTTAEGDMPF